MLTNIMRCKSAWNVFFRVDNKCCTHFLLECAVLVCTNGFFCCLLKVILGIQQFLIHVCCWSNGMIEWDDNCIYKRRDPRQIKLFLFGVFCWAWPLVARCNRVNRGLQWCWTGIQPCIKPQSFWFKENLVVAVKGNNQCSVACLYFFHTSFMCKPSSVKRLGHLQFW